MLPVGPGRCLWLRGGCKLRTPSNRYRDRCRGRVGRHTREGAAPCHASTSLMPSPLYDNFPSDRVVSKDTGGGGGGPISSPIWQPPPPPRPPLGLLPVPLRARVKGVSSAHHEEMGRLPAGHAAVVGSLRTHDPRALQAGADERLGLVAEVSMVLYFYNIVCRVHGFSGCHICVFLVCRSSSFGKSPSQARVGGDRFVIGEFSCW